MPTSSPASALVHHFERFTQQLDSLDLSALARQCRFLQRSERKISMSNLVKALLSLSVECRLSLERVAAVIGGCAGTTYSKQALQKRLGPAVEAFLTQVAVRLFAQFSRSSDAHPWLASFPRVLLHDSSTQSLPQHLASAFPGSSNQRSHQQAAVKVHLIAELRQGSVQHLSLSSFRRNDQAAAQDILQCVQPGDLVLRDLGYFVLSVLEALIQKGAFFLSRYRHGTTVLDPDSGQPLDLVGLLRTQGFIDRRVWLGEERRLPVRLVAIRVPEAVANERRRRARANRDQRLHPSSEHLFLLGWNIFVTNVPRDTWPPKAIQPIYRLRWRVEMVFKTWKSHLGLRELNCHSADLLRLSLLTKLLFGVLVCQLCHHFELLQTDGRHVSLLRLGRILAECSCLVATAILGISPSQWLAHQIQSHAFYEKRRDRKNFFEILANPVPT